MRRKIAAILAADVAGYSKLVAEDEEETLRRLASYRGVFDELVRQHNGRIFNEAGDAVLAEYPSAVDAVRCAVDIQESLRTRNLAYPASRHINFRIGITIGDVVERDGDLLGDGVNIAARLEGLASPGGICVSRSVHEAVVNKMSVAFADLGEQEVKNIPNPVHVYQVSLAGAEHVAGPQVRPTGWPRARVAIVAGGAMLVVGAVGLAALWTRQAVAPGSAPAAQASPAASAIAVAGRVAGPIPAQPTAQKPATAPGSSAATSQTGPYDGVWSITATGGPGCAVASNRWQARIESGALSPSRPEPGRVQPTGEFSFVLPAQASVDVLVRYEGRLEPDRGTGRYRGSGGCEGTIELARIAVPSPATIDVRAFNGAWTVAATGGEGCLVKSATWNLEIAEGRLLLRGKEVGRIEAGGRFAFSQPGRANPNLAVDYEGNLAGNGGTGSYRSGPRCTGTLVLWRVRG